MSLLYVLLICVVVGAAVGQKCQTCMKNGAYCVDTSTYYICPDGKNPEKSLQMSCASTHLCTDHADICVIKTDLTANSVCDAAGACNDCSKARMKCVSRTQYAPCIKPDMVLSCSADEVCSMDAYNDKKIICIPECVMAFNGYTATCSSIAPLTTSTVTPEVTTPTSEADLKSNCVNEAPSNPGPFFLVPNCADLTCRRYIYCQKSGPEYSAMALVCETGFFDKTTNACVGVKPTNCSCS